VTGWNDPRQSASDEDSKTEESAMGTEEGHEIVSRNHLTTTTFGSSQHNSHRK
jgi:hypothetical protein